MDKALTEAEVETQRSYDADPQGHAYENGIPKTVDRDRWLATIDRKQNRIEELEESLALIQQTANIGRKAQLHPTGICTCGGEGRCLWCQWDYLRASVAAVDAICDEFDIAPAPRVEDRVLKMVVQLRGEADEQAD